MTIRMRVLPRFPARISGTNGITVVRDNLDLVVQPDWASLERAPAIDQAHSYMEVWNDETNEYQRLAFVDAFNVSIPIYDTAIGVPGVFVSGGTSALRTNGYYQAGDGGGALYARVDTEPTHEAKLQSGDGAWWELTIEPGGLYAAQVGADKTGTSSSVTAIQNALNFLSAKGGGILHFYTGRYLIDTALNIPDFCGISGSAIVRHSQTAAGIENVQYSTRFLITHGKGQTGTPTIVHRRATLIERITFFYPDQVLPDMTDPHTGVVQASPYTYGFAISSWQDSLIDSSQCMIRDLNVGNAYQGVYAFFLGQNVYERIYGNPIFLGMKCDQHRDLVRVKDLHFWPFGGAGTTTALGQWILTNGQAISVGNVDGTIFERCFAFGFATGLNLQDFGNGGAWATFISFKTDTCNQPLRIRPGAIGGPTSFIGCQFLGALINSTAQSSVLVDSGATMAHDYDSCSFINCTFAVALHGVDLRSTNGRWLLDGCIPEQNQNRATIDPHGMQGFTVIKWNLGAALEVSNCPYFTDKSIVGVSSGSNTIVDGVAFPTTDTLATPTGLQDPTSWTISTPSLVTSITGGMRINMITNALETASFTIPTNLKEEVGPFYLTFNFRLNSMSSDVVSAGGQFYLRIMSGTNLVAELMPRFQPRWSSTSSPISLPIMFPPFSSAITLQVVWGQFTGTDFTLDIANMNIFRTVRETVDNRLLESMNNSLRWMPISGVGLPVKYEAGRKYTYSGGNVAPADGTHAVGDRRIRIIPAASSASSWCCTAAGTPGTWKVETSLGA